MRRQGIRAADPGVLEGLVRGHALDWVDGETAVDEVAGAFGDAAPELVGLEGVVGD